MQFIGEGYRIFDSKWLCKLATSWERKVIAAGQKNLWADRISNNLSNRKIRVGYMSADFCDHPVGRFIAPILRCHDKERFEIIGINLVIIDIVKEDIKKSCDEWVSIQHVNDNDSARMISDKQLDILIELGVTQRIAELKFYAISLQRYN